MLTRILVDNYRCFERFELRPGGFNLLLGANGTGKSSVLDVLSALLRHVSGRGDLDALFPDSSLARRGAKGLQRFELEARIGEAEYGYRLAIEHGPRGKAQVAREEVTLGGHSLLHYDGAEVAIHDPGSALIKYPFAGGVSPLASLPSQTSRRVSVFVDYMRSLWVIRPVPQRMAAETQRNDPWLASDLSNFSAWFGELMQEDPRVVERITRSLRPVLDGFVGFTLSRETARSQTLRLKFKARKGKRSDDGADDPGFALDQLSDGQRMLVALYTLLHVVVRAGRTLLIDEPDNFVAMPEIQPWLDELRDGIDEKHGQAFVVSHHPRLTNLYANRYGFWFERKGTGRVSVRRIAVKPEEGGIPVAELLAR